MAESIKMIPLQVEGDVIGPMEWPVSETEYNELMQVAEEVFGKKPTEISFVVRLPVDSATVHRLLDMQKQLLLFGPEDRLLYFNALKSIYCMTCGGIMIDKGCHYCKAK